MARSTENKCYKCKNWRNGQCVEDMEFCPVCQKCVYLDDDYGYGYGEAIHEIHRCPDCGSILADSGRVA